MTLKKQKTQYEENEDLNFKIKPEVNITYSSKNIAQSIEIILNEYPTHTILYTYKTDRGKKNKGDVNTTKVNGQYFYNGKLNKHTRNAVMGTLHNYYNQCLTQFPEIKEAVQQMSPLKIKMDWHTIPNHEAVKVLRNKLRYPVVDYSVAYDPAFDADNQWPYIKAFQDTLTKELNYLEDDNVKYLPFTGGIQYTPVDDFTKRKLVFTITPHSEKFKDLWLKAFKFWRDE